MDKSIHKQTEGAGLCQGLLPADLGGCHHLCLLSRASPMGEMHFVNRVGLWGQVMARHQYACGPLLHETSASPAPHAGPTVPTASLDPGRGCFQMWESWKEGPPPLHLVPLFAALRPWQPEKGESSRGGLGRVQSMAWLS